MFLCPTTRQMVLSLLPKQGHVVEIGVAEGNFSAQILDRNHPRQLTLVDPWEKQTRDDYQTDLNNCPAEEQEGRFQNVRRRFSYEISRGVVAIKRSYSQQAAADFAEHSLDWIYIDGLHSQAGVTADLESYHTKIKQGGLILGHDYCNHPYAVYQQFGVVEAVNQFVQSHNYALLALTTEPYPTFVMTDQPHGDVAQQFVTQLLYTISGVTEVRDYPHRLRYQSKLFRIQGNQGGRDVVVPSFGVE
ncbi:hypothetical protein Mmc1_3663 [Magnetococcus marinus MC-1]|uniref:Class I SAM-dependent methyltransferase n=1 Tax=Magnetococcus marinus (strain ATCC BAA-1437 / JCM 17883 / MC-1) TaxID=156889 RepID=A0LDV5_MAGMM|nr:class I SAM-dependent methyltransferase [Magnetococcus marinus]ABK46148.1 hypothetical protein Mmc1_3663 [Magnetococcus marinus MC-1]